MPFPRWLLLLLVLAVLLIAWLAYGSRHGLLYRTDAHVRDNTVTLWQGERRFTDAELGRLVREQLERKYNVILLPDDPEGRVTIEAAAQ